MEKNSPGFYLTTLGCKVNQYESQALREVWLAKGRREVSQARSAGIVIVNSCAVTAKAVADVRATVRRLHREAPEAGIIVTGCAAEVLGEELAALPGVIQVIPQSAKGTLADLQGLSGDSRGEIQPFVLSPRKNAGLPFPPFSVSGSERSRAVLKIQDGCSHGCAYCIVPMTRGGARSRPYGESLAEARRLLESGFREIMISGVNLRQYQDEDAQGRSGFWEFLARLDRDLAPEWQGRARLRLSSLEPGQLYEGALQTLAACRLVAPHLHISLQSGSPSVLQRMGRGHYDPSGISAFLRALRDLWPVFGLGADILTAFPGETEEEFQQTLALCREIPFSYAHVFPYSRRPGTRAALLPNHVSAAVKKERAAGLRSLVQEKKQDFFATLLKLPVMRVVFENRPHASQRDPLRGVNEFYIDCRLNGKADAMPVGILVPVCPTGIDGDMLLVEAAREAGACP